MRDLELYKNLQNEAVTSISSSRIISKVFENKIKSQISEGKFSDGGSAENDEVYTPYEFLHELMPKVYGRNYIVSDDVAEKYEIEIQKEQEILNEYIQSKLLENNVMSIYDIENKLIIEEIEIRKRKINSRKAFISESELNAYLFCHPELNSEHYVKKVNFDKNLFIEKGLIFADAQPQVGVVWTYKYEYLSGNVYQKLTNLRHYRSILLDEGVSDAQIDFQESMLNKAKPKKAIITMDNQNRINIHPNSHFGTTVFYVQPEDWNNIEVSRSFTLISAWQYWSEREMETTDIKHSPSLSSIHKYYTRLERPSASSDAREFVNNRRRAFADGEYLFNKFLNEALNENCKTRLEYMWNELYNSNAQQLFYKIPIALTLSRKFKTNIPFIPNETQVQSVQYIKNAGSGLLAYGVGVGKTASSIMNVSYAIDNGIAKKPLFCVPNATYEKWIKEVKGGNETTYTVTYFEGGEKMTSIFTDFKKATKFAKESKGELSEKEVYLNGLLPHVKNIVSLHNLNAEIVKNTLKKYSTDDLLQMKQIDELHEFLKTVNKDFGFEDGFVLTKIRSLYNDFETDRFLKDYQEYYNDEYKKQKIKYPQEPKVLTKLQFFQRGILQYKKELVYILGELKPFNDNTIFFITFEGLKYLGLKTKDNESLRNDSLFGKFFAEFTEGEQVQNFTYAGKTSSDLSKFENVVYGVENKAKLNIEDFNFDFAVFDESHYFKKIFTESKGQSEGYVTGRGTLKRKDKKYQLGDGDSATSLSLSAWFVTRYVQSKNNGNNTIQLTATPFTNKPSEIYSMLALTNYESLMKSGYKTMESFFELFMAISFEFAMTPSQKIVRKEVLTGFNNLPQMRNIIYNIMDYKSGEDANIKRPNKILFPSVSHGRDTTLVPTTEQENMFTEIKAYVKGAITYGELCGMATETVDVDEFSEQELLEYIDNYGSVAQQEKWSNIEKPIEEEDLEDLKRIVAKFIEQENKTSVNEDELKDDEKELVRVLKGLSMLKQVTLSPYLSTCRKELGIEPTFKQYVESSPKFIYTLNCIKSIHEYEKENNLKKSGIVIYMNIGVNPSFKGQSWKEGGFEKLKAYLVNEMGYKSDEISIVSGKVNPIQKEKEKNKFLSGQSTVLIGSSTISTGVDLQNNASALFLCSYDWNPTDNEQIGGRIHRQGNRFPNIRIVYPMIINSADPIIFQLLNEKSNRIKSIWDKDETGATLDLKDFDPKVLKRSLLDDPSDKVTFWIEENKTELQDEKIILVNRLESLRQSSDTIKNVNEITPMLKGVLTIFDGFKKNKTRIDGVKNIEEKRNAIIEEFGDDDVKMAKELTKLKKESYDFKNDPDGKFVYQDFKDLTLDELLVKVNSQMTNSDSFLNKLDYDDRIQIQEFFKQNFPVYYEGRWDAEANPNVRMNIDFTWISGLLNYANKWKGSFRDYKKLKEKLLILGIDFESIDTTKQIISERIELLDDEIKAVDSKREEKYQEFVLEKEANRKELPTMDGRISEFSAYNYILNQEIKTFAIDEAKFVETPSESLVVEKKIAPKKEKVEAKSSEADYLKSKIEAFQDMLEIEDDENEIQYLKDKIEAFQDMLELELELS